MPNNTTRAILGRIGAAERWGRCEDRAKATEPARRGLRAKFEREADPDGTLPPDELEYRVEQLMKAHMLRMSLAAAKARKAKATKKAG